MRKKLERAPKIAGVPVSKDTIKSLSQAAKDVIMNNRADLTERERRYNICLQCPDRKHDRCGLCGCFIKTKTILLNSECPVGKWRLPLLSEPSINNTGGAETNE